jgi:hypothetical protein
VGPAWTRHLSKTTIQTCVLVFAAGVMVGVVTYLQRSSVLDSHDAGSNAITLHVGLALIAAFVAVMAPRVGLAQRAPYPIWVAPFSRSGLDRFRRTVSLRSGASPGHVARAVLAGLLAIALLLSFFRAGQQVVAGLDPNFTVNAWGGPSYLGAMLGHYLDGLVLFYLEALILNMVLLEGGQ